MSDASYLSGGANKREKIVRYSIVHARRSSAALLVKVVAAKKLKVVVSNIYFVVKKGVRNAPCEDQDRPKLSENVLRPKTPSGYW